LRTLVLLPATSSSAAVGAVSPGVAVGAAPGVTVSVQAAAAASVAPQVLVLRLVPAGKPVLLAATSSAGWVPTLVMVSVRGWPENFSASCDPLRMRVVAGAGA